MQKTVPLSNILEEIERLKESLKRLESMIEELMDSNLTPEEEKLVKEVKERIAKGDFSEFVDLDEICIE